MHGSNIYSVILFLLFSVTVINIIEIVNFNYTLRAYAYFDYLTKSDIIKKAFNLLTGEI